MSKLKVYEDINDYVGYDDTPEKMYDKYESDLVIAEKGKEIAELQKQVHDYAQGLYVIQSRAEKEARRHKYKRCLANAEACMHKRWRPDEGFDYAKITRHMNKWLEIAEKFKEAK